MDIKQLYQQRADAAKVLKDLAAKADQEARDFTPEEQAQWDAKKSEIERTNRAIERAEEVLKQERESAARPGQTSGTGGSGVIVTLDEADRPFRSLGEQLQAVYFAGSPGGRMDSRLLGINAAASGASGNVASDGGFLVQHDFSTDLFRRAYDLGTLSSRCVMPGIGENANGLEAPYIDEESRATGSRWGGVQVYRRAEAETVAPTRPKIGKWICELEDMMGIAYATERLLQDAQAIASVFQMAFEEEFSFKLDDEILRGNGAGQCLGILNSPALVSVAKESGQAADTVVAANIVKMWARMWSRSRANSAWFINFEILEQLPLMTLGTGTVTMLWMPPGGLSGGQYGTLFGRPVIDIEQCSALGDVGDIVLADLSQYVLIKKGGIRADQSIHVRFVYDERAFRWVSRVNGQPRWKTALTPYKGAAGKKVSPFVTLDARA